MGAGSALNCQSKITGNSGCRPGLAHGFLVLSDETDFLYKTTDYYAPQHERCIVWNDPDIGIQWPLEQHGLDVPLLSDKDAAGLKFSQAEYFP